MDDHEQERHEVENQSNIDQPYELEQDAAHLVAESPVSENHIFIEILDAWHIIL